ncbi:uncharacterized protein BDFB_001643 [Asbolus verrucosus]|uniref:V-type proton ATPase subunit S1 n=1 Tax=Asbolus verrucosus TaxID=1661398 RepID=A0A482VMZ3_ASBVE|nr:uncharacterized protein BDFB_001643 [Asbolus verrucosus]
MYLKTGLFFIVLCVCHTNGAVLLWSNHKFEVSPLKSFNDDNFDELVQELGYPEVTLYKTSSSFLPEFQEFLKGYYTAYNPNGDISTENATEISGRDDLMQLETKQRIDSSLDNNVLSVLVVLNGRNKRTAISPASSSTTEQSASVAYKTGPVFYKGKSVKDIYGLLYSSQPLLLKTNSSSLYLGNTSLEVTVDTAKKESLTRLNVRFPVEDNNVVSLRFIFAWSVSNYWSLTSVKITDTNSIYSFDLNIEQEVGAPANFAYHCSGETVFSFYNSSNTVELYVYDIQTQIDSSNGKFGDSYDCVYFTTGPILSGLFVSTILGIGLILGLVAISEIKTMDKFDNQKTKQLVITVAD